MNYFCLPYSVHTAKCLILKHNFCSNVKMRIGTFFYVGNSRAPRYICILNSTCPQSVLTSDFNAIWEIKFKWKPPQMNTHKRLGIQTLSLVIIILIRIKTYITKQFECSKSKHLCGPLYRVTKFDDRYYKTMIHLNSVRCNKIFAYLLELSY